MVADRFQCILPHEVLMGERDVPGEQIATWLLIFDVQCLEYLFRQDARGS